MAAVPTGKSHILLILLFLFLLTVRILAESRHFIYSSYNNDMTHNPVSKYSSNLNTALSSLITTNSRHGFHNSSVGVGIDAANVILLCRGDVDRSTCQSCLNDSIVELTQRYPNATKATILYDDCFLRFSNETILGYNYTEYRYYFSSWSGICNDNNNNNMESSDHFKKELRSFIEQLINEAASGGSLLKFATGNLSLADSMEISNVISSGNSSEMDLRSIYGLVQCMPDLSMEECNDCLEKSLIKIMDYEYVSTDARIVTPWCTIRYSNVLFYNNNNNNRVIGVSSPAVLASSTSTPSEKKLRSRWLI